MWETNWGRNYIFDLFHFKLICRWKNECFPSLYFWVKSYIGLCSGHKWYRGKKLITLIIWEIVIQHAFYVLWWILQLASSKYFQIMYHLCFSFPFLSLIYFLWKKEMNKMGEWKRKYFECSDDSSKAEKSEVSNLSHSLQSRVNHFSYSGGITLNPVLSVIAVLRPHVSNPGDSHIDHRVST